MFYPRCRAEYSKGVIKCTDCEPALVEPARLMVVMNRAEEVRILLKDLRLAYKGIDVSGDDKEK